MILQQNYYKKTKIDTMKNLTRIFMFILISSLVIGNYSFAKAKSIVIERGIHQVGATAKIVMPTKAIHKGEVVELAKVLKQEDKVEIRLGYEGVYEGLEFSGFVKRIQEGRPLVLECEDNIYKLRQKNYLKSWKNTTLAEVVQYLLKDTEIALQSKVPNVKLKTFYLKNVNGAEALMKLKEEYGLSAYFNTEGKLYVGLAYTNWRNSVRYNLLKNVIHSRLKFRKADDIKLKVKAVHIKGDNTKTEVEVGAKDGALRTFYFYDIESKQALKDAANEKLQKYRYDGYEGAINTFLIPYCAPNMAANVVDPDFGRDGKYFIEKVKTTFSRSGARREIALGVKLS